MTSPHPRRPCLSTAREARMTRRHFAVLAIACVLIVPVVLAPAPVVDAEATHSDRIIVE